MNRKIRERPPTIGTYSMPQSQEEFYLSLPCKKMDLCLIGRNNDVSISEVAGVAGLTVEQVGRVYRDIDAKREATRYLHAGPVLMEEVAELPL